MKLNDIIFNQARELLSSMDSPIELIRSVRAGIDSVADDLTAIEGAPGRRINAVFATIAVMLHALETSYDRLPPGPIAFDDMAQKAVPISREIQADLAQKVAQKVANIDDQAAIFAASLKDA